MTIRRLMLIGVLMVAMFLASSFVVYGQSTVESDLKVGSEDISFSPTPPAEGFHVGTSVQISADVHNLGIAYIVLGDNNDQVEYTFTTTSIISGFRIQARIRSSNGNPLTANVWVGTITPNPLVTSSTTWEEKYTTFALNIGTGSHYLKVKLVGGGDYADLHIDWVELLNYAGTEVLYSFEAEAYVSGGGSVNKIHPQSVTTQFFQGDPDAGGTQIDDDQIVGNEQKTVETGTVWILTEGASATASVTWVASPPGYWDIYVRVLPDPREQNLDNNEAFKTIGVYAILTITATEGGTTDPPPGDHKYYGGTATVTAYPIPGYVFSYWELDGVERYGFTIAVEMSVDHTLHAVFHSRPVGGIQIPVDKLGLMAPYIALAVAVVAVTIGAVYARKRWFRKAVVGRP